MNKMICFLGSIATLFSAERMELNPNQNFRLKMNLVYQHVGREHFNHPIFEKIKSNDVLTKVSKIRENIKDIDFINVINFERNEPVLIDLNRHYLGLNYLFHPITIKQDELIILGQNLEKFYQAFDDLDLREHPEETIKIQF